MIFKIENRVDGETCAKQRMFISIVFFSTDLWVFAVE